MSALLRSKVVRDCYGAEVIDELVTRPGSPVSFQAMALATPAVLAEWAILIQRTHELERFMATELGLAVVYHSLSHN